MSVWFTSLRGALTLAAIALLSGLANVTLIVGVVSEFSRFVREDQPSQLALVLLFFLGYYGGWIWALLAAARGSRGGLIVSLALALRWSLPNIIVFALLCPLATGVPHGRWETSSSGLA